MSIMFNPVPNLPKHNYKASRTRSTQLNFDVIINNFLDAAKVCACSCWPIHKRLLLCCLPGLHHVLEK